MEQQNSFRKIAGWLAILSVFFAYGNFALTGIAASGKTQDLSGLNYFIHVGEQAGNLMKWSWLSDMIGYYLLLIPVSLLLYYWLKNKNPYWMGVFTFCGLAYIFAGSSGAAMLAKTWPALISGFTNSSGTSQEIYKLIFENTTEMVYGGLWGYFEFLLAGVWWLGIGFTIKTERKALGIATIILGVFTLLAVVGEFFSISYVAMTGMMVYLLFAPIWAGWLGISVLQGKDIQLTNP